jgi:hypothetical protein
VSIKEYTMRTIETHAVVSDDGKLTIQVPPDVTPGEHQVKLIIEEFQNQNGEQPAEFLVIHVDSWPEGLSFRREDMYGDEGR